MDLAVSIVKHLFAEQGNVVRLEDFVVQMYSLNVHK